MFIEAVDHPIRYRFPGGEIRLEPGRPVEVEPARAAKLLAKAGAKVRAVADSLQVGMIVEWDSPLFGILRSVALEVTDQMVLVHHPLTEQEVSLPRNWVKGETR